MAPPDRRGGDCNVQDRIGAIGANQESAEIKREHAATRLVRSQEGTVGYEHRSGEQGQNGEALRVGQPSRTQFGPFGCRTLVRVWPCSQRSADVSTGWAVQLTC